MEAGYYADILITDGVGLIERVRIAELPLCDRERVVKR